MKEICCLLYGYNNICQQNTITIMCMHNYMQYSTGSDHPVLSLFHIMSGDSYLRVYSKPLAVISYAALKLSKAETERFYFLLSFFFSVLVRYASHQFHLLLHNFFTSLAHQTVCLQCYLTAQVLTISFETLTSFSKNHSCFLFMHIGSTAGEWCSIMSWQAAASVGIRKKAVVTHNEYKGCPGSNIAYLHADKK